MVSQDDREEQAIVPQGIRYTVPTERGTPYTKMLSIETIRDQTDRVKASIANRGLTLDVDRILELDVRRREIIVEVDALRARRNDVSRDLGKSKEKPPELIAEMREVGVGIKGLEGELREVADEYEGLLLEVPNILDDEVPIGEDESQNIVLKTVGDAPTFGFEPKPHWELGEDLDIIDIERAVKLAGSRFYMLKGKGATLQRALIAWLLDLHNENGYDELYVPHMVTRETATGSGQLPKFADTMYHDEEDDLWMIPTAEVPITIMHGNEILEHGTLPLSYVAHTPSYRREKASAGRDTRGIKRIHQFEKVEMFKFSEPQDSMDALETMTSQAEDICRRLGIHHRVLLLCTGDIGFASIKTYDVELWAPGSQDWLEVSSVSNCTDFQARRAKIRYRTEEGARPQLLHTLNGSGLGIPRTLIAILENYQQADGSIVVPEVLRRYTGFDVIETTS